MTTTLTPALLGPLVGEQFTIRAADGEVVARLEQLDLAAAPPAPGMPQGFSITFRGPVEPALQQGMHELVHDRIGPVVVFLVPLARDAAGSTYEAVFG